MRIVGAWHNIAKDQINHVFSMSWLVLLAQYDLSLIPIVLVCRITHIYLYQFYIEMYTESVFVIVVVVIFVVIFDCCCCYEKKHAIYTLKSNQMNKSLRN